MTDAESKINNEINTNETKMNAELNTKIVEEVVAVEEKKKTPKKSLKTKPVEVVAVAVAKVANLVIENDPVVEKEVIVENKVTFAEPLEMVSCSSSASFDAKAEAAFAELEELMALKKQQEFINRRVAMIEGATKIKKNVLEYKDKLINARIDKVKSLRMNMDDLLIKLKKADMEIECLASLSTDELVTMMSGNEEIMEELGLTKTKTTKTKTKTDSDDDEPTAKSIAYHQRKDEWKSLPEGQEMVMTYNKSGRKYRKVGDTLVAEKDGVVYKSMNDAVKKYKLEIGDTKSFGSAWSLFKML